MYPFPVMFYSKVVYSYGRRLRSSLCTGYGGRARTRNVSLGTGTGRKRNDGNLLEKLWRDVSVCVPVSDRTDSSGTAVSLDTKAPKPPAGPGRKRWDGPATANVLCEVPGEVRGRTNVARCHLSSCLDKSCTPFPQTHRHHVHM